MTDASRTKLRVMIAGGGTGGHVFPGIAIYRALCRGGDVDVLFVGAKAGVEASIFEGLGLPHVLLPGRGVRGGMGLARIVSPFLLATGILRAIGKVRAFSPDVVIGTGGYASVAAVAAAVLCGRRRVLQEQNSVPGLANRALSRFADLVLLSYAESRAFLGRSVPCALIGNPLRVKPGMSRDAALEFLDLKPDRPTVLVLGGSRGAHQINLAATAAVQKILPRREVQFVLLTGENDYADIERELGQFGSSVRVYPFLQEIGHAYAAADIAVSRAGASAVFELAAFGVPSVFVPYPYAADDHQRRNVEALGRSGAAIIMDSRDVDGARLETIIMALLDDEDRRREMSARLREWSWTDADDTAARFVRDLVAGRLEESALHVWTPAGDEVMNGLPG